MLFSTLFALTSMFLACGSDGSTNQDSGQSSADTGSSTTDTIDTSDTTDTQTQETGSSCVDDDGDGFGEGCDAGPDCDDTVSSCNTDCSDVDVSGTPDCAESVGEGVFLYNGAGGGAYDIYEADVAALFSAAGISVTVGATIPAGLVDDYGTLILMSPTTGYADSLTKAGVGLLARGGRVVVVTEHSGYADHAPPEPQPIWRVWAAPWCPTRRSTAAT
jgi:hypothetical protein